MRGFFGVVDSVNFLESERLDSKPTLDSVFSLHSALGSASLDVDCVGLPTQTKKLVIAVVLVEFLAGAGVGAT